MIDVVDQPHGCLATLRGEFDLVATETVRSTLNPHLDGDVMVDLRQVTFMDSSGLSCLLQLRTDAAQRGGPLVVTDVSAVVRRLFELSGIADELLGPDS